MYRFYGRGFSGLVGLMWQTDQLPGDDSIYISITLGRENGRSSHKVLIKRSEELFKFHKVEWISIIPGGWVVNCDRLRSSFSVLSDVEWLSGNVFIEPDFEWVEEHGGSVSWSDRNARRQEIKISIVIDKVTVESTVPIATTPVEIQESMVRFSTDHPEPRKNVFIMMRFANTPLHDRIVVSIRKVLEPLGLTALRADDKQYHEDIYWNIMTYIYGCSFGIAVFERITTNDFNPNVSLEVGYMLGMRRDVCLLKDITLTQLQTDLVGRLYRPFDTQDLDKTIKRELGNWLRDKDKLSVL